MKKSVLMSAKPYWIYLILIGRKEVEVRKDFPKSPDWDQTVEMYCSKDKKSFNRIPKKDREWMRKYLGKVVCGFVCDYITKARADTLEQAYAHNNPEETCLTDRELYEYATIGKPLSFLHISELTIYATPRELSEFKKYNGCGRCMWNLTDKCDNCNNAGNGDDSHNITRPPQSWCYVEKLKIF